MTRNPRAFLSLAFTLVALLAFAAIPAFADVETRVAREAIAPGETVDLLLRIRGADAGVEPAWSELGDDFDIVDARRSERTSIVNGRRDHSVDWRVALAPRRTGALEIPAIAIGGSHSEPVAIVVSASRPGGAADPFADAGADARPATPALSLDLEADDTTPYVQGRVLLTARIAAGPELLEGHLTDPEVEGAVLERVGEDSSYPRTVNGRPGVVIERRYAVFPQRSGTLEIPPLVFEGRVRDTTPPPPRQRARRFGGRSLIEDFFGRDPFDEDFFGGDPFSGGVFDDLFGARNRTRTVRALSEGITLDVKPRPAGASDQWWIPAHSVELIERWESEPPVFRVGEPVSRTVAIRATGLSGAQLPELTLPPVDGAKQYVEPSLDETTTSQDQVVAIKAQRTSLIPTAEGALTLPAIEIDWWDTLTDAPRTARLEARVVQVLPGAAGTTPTPPPSEVAAATAGDAAAPAADPTPKLLPGPLSAWIGGGIALAGIALALALLSLRRRRARKAAVETRPSSAATAPAAPGRAAAERALRRACRGSDPAGASAALRDLAHARWPGRPPRSAAAWGRSLDSPELRDAIADLDRVRYSRDASEWCGDGLWQAYRRAGRRRGDPGGDRARSDAKERLPALYPSR